MSSTEETGPGPDFTLEERHEFLIQAADEVEYRWERYVNASDNLSQADALIELSNSMSDLASFLPGFNPETGEVEREEV